VRRQATKGVSVQHGASTSSAARPGPLGLTPYQWLVLFAAWLGWGFDVFDGLLFNFVSPLCVPSLLGVDPASPEGREATALWTGALTSMLLVGWAIGGILFGWVADRFGRTRTLLLTMLVYALATLACAFAPNLAALAVFRFIASLGIGGEWAAGASLVAETVPEERRVIAGALLYTSAPMGLFLATFVNDLLTRQIDVLAANPDLAWRAVFATGIVPAFVAVAIRWKVREPERWSSGVHPRLRELFAPELRARTLGGLAVAIVALVTWWSVNAFLPMIARYLVDSVTPPPPQEQLAALRVSFVTTATSVFNLGGLVGTLLTVPVALHLGRRPMFLLYFAASALAIWLTFGFGFAPETRLYLVGLIGLSVFGVFGAFTFYLPELFPTRLRATGSGFTYNAGRVATAAGPFIVGLVAASGMDPLGVVRWVALVPLVGIVLVIARIVPETRGQNLG
jgi:MFS family permease